MTTFDDRASLNYATLAEEPTLFSNRLIGLAISVDSNFSTRQKSDKDKFPVVATDSELKNSLIVNVPNDKSSHHHALLANPTHSQSIKRKARRPGGIGFKKTPGVTIRPCENSFQEEMNRDMEATGVYDLSYANDRDSQSHWSSFPKVKEGTNLITVFSSPCPNYYGSSSRRFREDSELPEYVKIMMEKDVALRRLVKTGCITISRISGEVGSGSEEEKWEDPDEYLEDRNHCTTTRLEPCRDSRETNGYSKPYEPPANMRDWADYPFARKLLEFTYAAIANSDTKYENSARWKGVSSSSSGSYPGSSASSKSYRDSELSLQNSIPKLSSNSQFKQRQKPQKLNTNWAESGTPGTFAPQSTTKLKKSVIPIASRFKTNASAGILRYAENNVPSTANGYSSAPEDAIDPSSFLEVSLQEMAMPDDSHRRKYKCIHCSKAFCWSTDLKRHILIHTGERPFQCSECPANFTRKFLMQKHLKKVHGQITASALDTPDLANANGAGTTAEDFEEDADIDAEDMDVEDGGIDNGSQAQYLIKGEISYDEECSGGEMYDPITYEESPDIKIKLENDEDEANCSGEETNGM